MGIFDGIKKAAFAVDEVSSGNRLLNQYKESKDVLSKIPEDMLSKIVANYVTMRIDLEGKIRNWGREGFIEAANGFYLESKKHRNFDQISCFSLLLVGLWLESLIRVTDEAAYVRNELDKLANLLINEAEQIAKEESLKLQIGNSHYNSLVHQVNSKSIQLNNALFEGDRSASVSVHIEKYYLQESIALFCKGKPMQASQYINTLNMLYGEYTDCLFDGNRQSSDKWLSRIDSHFFGSFGNGEQDFIRNVSYNELSEEHNILINEYYLNSLFEGDRERTVIIYPKLISIETARLLKRISNQY
ncbi:hypothetical protein HQ393_12145 [Chitinibacter bivalviorum]|uniref:Uncharacterized protein n=1 Tax=Chitinibacter bivalviorum TaxID=2739434 RepID=A0A7H9BJR7_9NEIS|nr:hypothetical protein [Chitinibacter bivalviorum]QLG88927.1 hypothetical protein HQ393_12145 [Chitinibacter bivalviorum]